MGSATTQALGSTVAALDAQTTIDLDTARELFAAARVVGESSQLSGALADPTAPAGTRARLVADIFGKSFRPATVAVLTATAQQRWSGAADLVDAIEELAVRAATRADKNVDVEGELFRVSRLVAENPQLELALGSRLGDSAAKGALVQTLLGGRASEATTLIVSSLVQQTGDRRVRQLLIRAMQIVADQRGRTVASVVTAAPLTAAQRTRLVETLSRRYGSGVSLNEIIDPAVVGGLRVQIADDVIDGSISSRLADLRQKLAV
ncbi:MAG TPA: F0F1 ATP synthase subunit delta [Microbacterium sp.]|uniref:F0F1 ATP synthase subunit delta n=1 Tax=Microbacterium sp. TaxID=51671 RepID=UPI002BA8AF54|nr:F0F1 ATP synthase subunit delta [Microbacterium sp.]HWI32646.1 F0F1 ATP synthase subunit delta [Microbacterium sp.]